MKKIFTLLWVVLAAFSFKSQAQNTSCNAEFSWQFLNSNTVKFTPVMTDSPLVQHSWNFGDASPVSHAVAPIHSYAAPGTYMVVHTIVRMNPNGIPVCTQSITRTIVIQAPCNLVVNFSWSAATANPLMIHFQNMSIPLEPSDSTKWTFGDGTISYAVNPVHTYANAGTYTVCLTVKKNSNTPGTTPCIRYICKTVVVYPPCNLVVNFSWAAGTNPLSLQFTNLTAPLAATDSCLWTFGDGTSSTLVNPAHTYSAPGTYTVCLKVKRHTPAGAPPCIREICKTVVVQAHCNLVVNFDWMASTSNPLMVHFQNQSTPLSPTDSTIWNFGDGNGSTAVNPIHTYAQAGIYNVCLIVKKYPSPTSQPCVRYICKTVVVSAPCNFVVDFSWNASTANPQMIHFNNTSPTSTPGDIVTWTFGDGSTGTGMSPVHTYAQGGTYTVCMRIKRPNPTINTPCIREICKTITVQQHCNFQPSFTWSIDPANPLRAIFTNTTNIPVANAQVVWTFGDGSSANTWNATHVYNQPGRYNVCLKIYLSNTCYRIKCDTILIPVPPPPCNNQSNFTVLRSSSNSQTFTFVPAYQSNAAVYTWTFGDGTGSHGMIATHHYANPGTYTACLTVWRSPTCASTTCKTVTVTHQVNCDSVRVTYSYQRDPVLPNKLYFHANSNYPILDQTWTIRKMINGQTVTLHQNNPSYVFPDTGLYKVCLRAVTFGNCVKEYCQYIRIEQVGGPNVCTLQAYPNPASSVVNVNLTLTAPLMIYEFIYNSSNVLVLQRQQQGVVGVNVVHANIANLVAGHYTIKLVYGNHNCYAQFSKL